jgi:two-component system OmpR family sensor kinase
VCTDADRLAQVVANLLENALKYADHAVRVTIAQDGSHLSIDVADDGRGIDAQDIPRVFERLYAGGRPARRQAGTGLGLAIVAELVSALGGEVRVSSDAANGTTFRVRLPII